MFLEEMFVKGNCEIDVQCLIKDTLHKDDKILTFISGDCGKVFKSILDKLKVKNNAIYTPSGERVKLERVEKELVEDDELTHVAIINSNGLDNEELYEISKKYKKIVITIE